MTVDALLRVTPVTDAAEDGEASEDSDEDGTDDSLEGSLDEGSSDEEEGIEEKEDVFDEEEEEGLEDEEEVASLEVDEREEAGEEQPARANKVNRLTRILELFFIWLPTYCNNCLSHAYRNRIVSVIFKMFCFHMPCNAIRPFLHHGFHEAQTRSVIGDFLSRQRPFL